MSVVYMVWENLEKNPAVVGVFDNEKQAQKVCKKYDCYQIVEVNRVYEDYNDIPTKYHVPSGKFINFDELEV